jgi:hypothetical protein
MQTTPYHEIGRGGGAVGNENLENYLKYGYVADDGPVIKGVAGGKAWVSNTYEYAYDDWCVAQLALALGRRDVADQFLKRSQSWRNVFDANLGCAQMAIGLRPLTRTAQLVSWKAMLGNIPGSCPRMCWAW